MKESELIKTRNKVESLRNVMQTVINKITMLETLVFSMTDIVKRLDQYESIIKQIQSERERDTKKIKKTTEILASSFYPTLILEP